ncbi:BCCT family transporter [Clostridium sediminicola]|uniref:BCCT family transporter n=1 Tax=Clostridium sediminicola TaxID=3114879 RepID=UPI0031F23765
MNKSKNSSPIDPKIFFPALILILAVAVPTIFFPQIGEMIIHDAYVFVTSKFSWLYLVIILVCFLIVIWLAFGRFGNVKLGNSEDEPEFSWFSYISMIFCGGIGISIMALSIKEPIIFLKDPPLGVEPNSVMAVEWAHAYGPFHFGPSAWAIFAIATIPIAYSVYVRKHPFLRVSVACKGVLGERMDGWIGKIVDIFVVIGIVGGVGTSLGLGVPLISALFNNLFGFEDTFLLKIMVLIIWTLLFGVSVYKGLTKGIRVLSDINIFLGLGLLIFILIVGPTLFIISSTVNSAGLLFSNFFRMSLWTDPVAKGGFTESWTAFYWAWWIAFAPTMGLFVARISKGRTIKEVIIAECVYGPLGCVAFYAIMGGYSLYLEINNVIPVSTILNEQGGPAANIAVMSSLPLPKLVLILYTILCFIFLATTLDSSAYTIASVCSYNISGNEQPARWHRVFWAIVIAIFAVALIVIGGLEVVISSTILASVPLIPVMIILTISIKQWLNEDFGKELNGEKLVTNNYPKIIKEDKLIRIIRK